MRAAKDPRVDAYIAKSAGFAKPILRALRAAVHAGCPEVEETLKWGHPSFSHHGMLCGMAAFKAHCTFGFWKHELLLAKGLKPSEVKAMGQFGRLASVADLPAGKALARLVQAAARLNADGVKRPAKPKPAKDRRLDVPPDFMSALKKSAKAHATFDGFTYSKKKDYVEWVTEAKTEETRQRRLATAIEWMAEGKSRNWKYEKC
jgi:uncharacterized protein YdeI (YjbR/CyaY-like superfamily)